MGKGKALTTKQIIAKLRKEGKNEYYITSYLRGRDKVIEAERKRKQQGEEQEDADTG